MSGSSRNTAITRLIWWSWKHGFFYDPNHGWFLWSNPRMSARCNKGSDPVLQTKSEKHMYNHMGVFEHMLPPTPMGYHQFPHFNARMGCTQWNQTYPNVILLVINGFSLYIYIYIYIYIAAQITLFLSSSPSSVKSHSGISSSARYVGFWN